MSHFKYDIIASNIVRCYGLTKHSETGELILVLNFMDFDLCEYLENNNSAINWKDRYRIIYKISACLHSMHEKDLIHKDLHPGNVLLQGKHQIRISDLGFCESVNNHSEKVYGCTPYIAPEVLYNNHYSTMSDIYSLGIIMWMVSAGFSPFYDQKHDIFLVKAIMLGLRPDVVYGTPPEYVELMKQCWDAIPENRPDARTIYKKIYNLLQNFSDDITNDKNSEIITYNTENDNNPNMGEHSNKHWSATAQHLSSGPKHLLKDNLNHLSSGPMNWIKDEQKKFSSGPKNWLKDKQKTFSSGPKNWIKDEQKKFSSGSIHCYTNLSPENFTKDSKEGSDDLNSVNDYASVKKLFEEWNIDENQPVEQNQDSNTSYSEEFEKIDSIESLKTHDTDEFEKVNDISESFETSLLQTHIIDEFEKVDLIESVKPDSTDELEKVNSFESVKPDSTDDYVTIRKVDRMNRIVDVLYLIFAKLHNENFNEKDANKVIDRFITKNNETSHTVFTWLSKNKINSEYICLLGRFYLGGIGTDENKEEAYSLFVNAANNGNYIAQLYTKEAFELFLESAKGGDSKGQTILGICYEDGIGTTKDKNKAFKWYLKSAEGGNTWGQYNLGRCYKNGIGIIKDENKAFKWYLKSAEGGNYAGQLNLGHCFRNGIGIFKDNSRAFVWYLKSAEGNSSSGQVNVGICYQNGIGVTKDEKKAFEWYFKSATNGNYTAQRQLGLCYRNGIGTSQDQERAIKWLQKSKNNKLQKPRSNDKCLENPEIESLLKKSSLSRIPFNELEIMRKIGKGGFATVYLGKWKTLDEVKPVALKLIHGSHRISEEFINEMHILFLNLRILHFYSVMEYQNLIILMIIF
ncbi:hypothetical protein C2G38_34622 [Gigaspora rosea]|uniref:Protein kinase domain-containing protein n=1 Tax=Gigaspora rosea TaxID=44941 RepID=A0A397UPU1_9GLOM|nr:hypothetical protein C2G38_34622 [Gigaspora rosea]